jgi:hypothetical protein
MGPMEQADGDSRGRKRNGKRLDGYHRYLKRAKARIERRRAHIDPECQPYYGKYRGWET